MQSTIVEQSEKAVQAARDGLKQAEQSLRSIKKTQSKPKHARSSRLFGVGAIIAAAFAGRNLYRANQPKIKQRFDQLRGRGERLEAEVRESAHEINNKVKSEIHDFDLRDKTSSFTQPSSESSQKISAPPVADQTKRPRQPTRPSKDQATP